MHNSIINLFNAMRILLDILFKFLPNILFIRYITATAAGELQASKQEFESAAVPLITGYLPPWEIQCRCVISKLKELILNRLTRLCTSVPASTISYYLRIAQLYTQCCIRPSIMSHIFLSSLLEQ